MKILKAAHGFMDIFLGEGWYNHSRVQKKKTKDGHKILHVSGIRLNKHQIQQVEKNEESLKNVNK